MAQRCALSLQRPMLPGEFFFSRCRASPSRIRTGPRGRLERPGFSDQAAVEPAVGRTQSPACRLLHGPASMRIEKGAAACSGRPLVDPSGRVVPLIEERGSGLSAGRIGLSDRHGDRAAHRHGRADSHDTGAVGRHVGAGGHGHVAAHPDGRALGQLPRAPGVLDDAGRLVWRAAGLALRALGE